MTSPSLHIVLVEPEIHWNTGNAGRTCLGVGAQLHLVRPLGFSLDEKQVRRAGLDYWDRVNPTVWPSFDDFEASLPSLGVPFFFSAESKRDLWSFDYPDETVLVFGKESAGFSEDIRQRYADRLVSIPMMQDSLRSINVSTCVGIAAFEVLRQHKVRRG